MRYAIYYSPEPGSRLWLRSGQWLGRDAATGDATRQPKVPGLSESEFFEITASARHYGFHATLKAPFRLASDKSEDQLLARLESFCAKRAPFDVALRAGSLDGFVALIPARRSLELEQLAGDVVRGFDDFRAPLSAKELARRKPEKLLPAEQEYLKLWGYPYVFDQFRFHLTLTKRLDPEQSMAMTDFAEEWFRQDLRRPLVIAGLALFAEKSPETPFSLLHYVPFGAPSKERPPE